MYICMSTSMDKAKQNKYMQVANFKANLFSKDPSTKVCALIIAPDSFQELSSGYNGMPRGINDYNMDRWNRPAKYMWVEHAERNAIYNASRRGTPIENAIMIVNKFPCADCSRAIIQCGIKAVITYKPVDDPKWNKSWEIAQEMLGEAKINVIYIE
jgi:dCMP deaminase